MSMNPFLTAVVMTKDELAAFRIICRLAEQRPDRLIVLDDYSSEDWLKTLRATIAPYPFVEIAQHHLADDYSAQRNFAKTLCAQDHWLVYIDSDEWVSPTFLKDLRNHIDNHPETDFILLDRCNTFYDPARPEDAAIPETLPATWKTDWQPRAFLNRPDLRYHLNVHEWLVGFHHSTNLTGEGCTIRHHRPTHTPTRYHHIVQHED